MSDRSKSQPSKLRRWLRRYLPAELLGTLIATAAAWSVFARSDSYLVAAAAGWVGEGFGFFGYMISAELVGDYREYRSLTLRKRLAYVVAAASTNLLVEFLPAELVDNFLVRPFAMFLVPQYVHPFVVGFLVAKFGADVVFYLLAISGFELRRGYRRRRT